MRSAFLLLSCIVLVLLIKTGTHKQKIERVNIAKRYIIGNNGTVFVPRSLRVDYQEVNETFIEITVARKNYMYRQCFNSYCLDNAEEVPVFAGDKIEVSYPVNLMIGTDV